MCNRLFWTTFSEKIVCGPSEVRAISVTNFDPNVDEIKHFQMESWTDRLWCFICSLACNSWKILNSEFWSVATFWQGSGESVVQNPRPLNTLIYGSEKKKTLRFKDFLSRIVEKWKKIVKWKHKSSKFSPAAALKHKKIPGDFFGIFF